MRPTQNGSSVAEAALVLKLSASESSVPVVTVVILCVRDVLLLLAAKGSRTGGRAAFVCVRGETGLRLLDGRDAESKERVDGERGREREDVSDSDRFENDKGGVDSECRRVRADCPVISVLEQHQRYERVLTLASSGVITGGAD